MKILDRASNDDKLGWKEMLYIRNLKPSLKVQKDSQLSTLIIRNKKQEDSITKDFQKYLKKPKNSEINYRENTYIRLLYYISKHISRVISRDMT